MTKPTIRKATLRDTAGIRKLVNKFALDGKMLALSFNQIYERLRDFWVIEERGRIVACTALKVIWKDLGEIRSLAVSRSFQKKGYGARLIEKVTEEAKALGMKKIFALTYVPDFFKKIGFEQVPKARLPHKIWLDCINCPKFPRCDETSMMRFL